MFDFFKKFKKFKGINNEEEYRNFIKNKFEKIMSEYFSKGKKISTIELLADYECYRSVIDFFEEVIIPCIERETGVSLDKESDEDDDCRRYIG